MQTRDRYKSSNNHDLYVVWRNKVNMLIRDAKQTYYRTLIEQNAKSSRDLWKYMKELTESKVTKVPIVINDNEKEITDEIDIANAFNNYFINITNKYIENVDNEDIVHSKLEEFINKTLPTGASFDIPCMSQEFVLKQLQGLQKNKATGLDKLGANVLKIASQEIYIPLWKIFNLSINTGIFPDIWKEARVVPLHKSGSLQLTGNYRPISVLPVLSKIIERHVHTHLYNYVRPLILESQSGFLPKHSCETALCKMVNSWSHAMDNDFMNGVIFVDLRKAFDLVSHRHLLHKLDPYRCNPTALSWFRSYLTDRKQSVQFKS